MILHVSLHYRWVVLSVFAASQVLLSIAGYGWAALAPFLKAEMALRDSQIGAISSAFYFAAAFSAFPAGVAVDRLGVRTCLMLWLALTGTPLLLIGLLPHHYSAFLLLCTVSGLGYGMGNPVAAKGLYSWFDSRIRATAFGIRQSAVTVGAAVAGVFVVSISQKAGPFAAIRTTGLMITAMIPLAFFLYRHSERDHERSARTSFKGGFTLLLRNRPFLVASWIMALLGLTQGAVVTFFILFLHEKLDIPLLTAGSFFSLLMLSGTIGRISWGVISDRFFKARRLPVIIGICLLTTLCELTLACWSAAWPVYWLPMVAVAVGLSSLSWNSIGLVLVTELCPGNRTAAAVGLASTIGWSGIFLGPLGFGTLLDAYGYFQAWFSMACCGFLALILCYWIPRSK